MILLLETGWNVPLPSPGSINSSINFHSPTIPVDGDDVGHSSLLQLEPIERSRDCDK
jgi:hypothetical protein